MLLCVYCAGTERMRSDEILRPADVTPARITRTNIPGLYDVETFAGRWSDLTASQVSHLIVTERLVPA